MSWFDTAGFASLAKSALKEAQKTFDKALDLESVDEKGPESDSKDKGDSDSFFSAFGLGSSSVSSGDVATVSDHSASSLWGSFGASLLKDSQSGESPVVEGQPASSAGASGPHDPARQTNGLRSVLVVAPSTSDSAPQPLSPGTAGTPESIEVLDEADVGLDGGEAPAESLHSSNSSCHTLVGDSGEQAATSSDSVEPVVTGGDSLEHFTSFNESAETVTNDSIGPASCSLGSEEPGGRGVSPHESGHTSADEIETATSSDVEVLASPQTEEVLAAREAKMVELSRLNVTLQEDNSNMQRWALTPEARRRCAELEEALLERDATADELRAEGEKLSREQLKLNTVIKRLRVKEREQEAASKRHEEKVARLTSEVAALGEQVASLTEADREHGRVAELERRSQEQDSQAASLALSAEIQAKQELEKSLAEYRSAVTREHDELLAQIEDLRLSVRRAERENASQLSTPRTSPTPSLARISFSSSFHELAARQAGTSGAATVVESLSAQLKQKEGELNQLRAERSDQDTMYGEKAEESEELKLDLADVKEMYKQQIDQLTKRS
ncbi:TATA element modulatory factor-like [Pollicipes pollicipes]|uniref:TATA element modulatory factor-like n=1 Tax=Pollicipes pollicipes TaxID=41117 RepID=UPI00188561DD|nr:TATA element modulatory factor-like [Pollicipes pollicipes]